MEGREGKGTADDFADLIAGDRVEPNGLSQNGLSQNGYGLCDTDSAVSAIQHSVKW